MKYTVEGCRHKKCEPYGTLDHNSPRLTCTTCYRRLRAAISETGRLELVPDYPAAPCEHARKQTVGAALNAKRDHMDAMCLDCGRVLRHPDGPGSWEEVRFYGYVIHEERW